jgi:flagellar biosynthetic protein FlhB
MDINEKLIVWDISLTHFVFDLQMFAAEDEGRTEEPTEYKRRKAREEGNIPRSQELTGIIVFLMGFWTVALIGGFLFNSLVRIMRFYLDNLLTIKLSKNSIVPFFTDMLMLSSSSVLPVMVIGIIAAVAAGFIQGGIVFSTKKLNLNIGRIFTNMGPNFLKLFWSRETLFNLLKSLLKVIGVFAIAIIIINQRLAEMLMISRMDMLDAFKLIWMVMFQFVSFSGVLLLIFAIGDYAFQRWIYLESLKMTKQEIKEEFKEMEGNPEIKAKIREMERRLLTRKMVQEIPKADVVITNPTHIAVALKYEPSFMNAPVLIAKGEGPLAERIKKIARENNVYIVENKPLAREIYKKVEVGQEIPPELFMAVAKILSLVYQIKGSVAA